MGQQQSGGGKRGGDGAGGGEGDKVSIEWDFAIISVLSAG
jgi:hypothetical protein